LDGLSYKQISAQLEVSVGAISKTLVEQRKRNPDIENLRALQLDLNKSKTNLYDARKGVQFLVALEKLGFDKAQFPIVLDFVRHGGKRSAELAAAGERLIELERGAGKPYEKLIAEFGEKLKAVEQRSVLIQKLEKRELELRNSIHHLEKLEALQTIIDKNNITPTRLETLIPQELRLLELGFIPEKAEVLASELGKRGLDPTIAASKIAGLLKERLDLEAAKENSENEVDKLKTEIKNALTNVDSLKGERERLQDKIAKLETDYLEFKESSNKKYEALTSSLKTDYESKQREQETHIQELKQTVITLTADIEKLTTVKAQFNSELSQAETALNTVEDSIKRSRPLTTIVRLIENPESLKALKDTLEMMLVICKSFQKYLETTKDLGGITKLVQPVKSLSERLTEELQSGVT